MKKMFLIAGLGALLLTSCMVNTPDYFSPMITPAPAPQTEEPPVEEPATEEPATEEPETEAPEVKAPQRRAPAAPAEPDPETEDEQEEPEEETPATPQEPETEPEQAPEETRVVDWRAFYSRVEQKGREKYDGRLPWNYLSRDAHIGMGSWMVDAASCSRCPPSETVIRKIAQVLEVTYEWLIYG